MELSTIEERVHNVRLNIYHPNGVVQRIGHSGPFIDWHLHKPKSLPTILKHPELELGNSYVRGEWDVDTRQLSTLIQVLISKQARPCPLRNHPRLQRLRARLPLGHKPHALPQWQDISVWVARICLGEQTFQTCGLFSEPGMALEQARRIRCRRLIARLQLQPDQELLDVNAGWGAMALFLARHADVRVTAITQTRAQLQFAQNEARRHGLEGRVRFRLGSFHRCRGRFDRILASGFLERHPESSYAAQFQRLEELLQDDGFAWIQVTGRCKHIGISNRWYQGQLASGCGLPLVSEMATAVESTGLRTLLLEDQAEHWLQDIEIQARRFFQHRTAISRRFGEQQTRHWEFTLASQATATRWGQLCHYEILLGNSRSTRSVYDPALHTHAVKLPLEIVNRIPGLARDI